MRPLAAFAAFALLLLPRELSAAPLEQSFARGNALYEAEEFEKAREAYLEILQSAISKEVLFNLGNANFRLGKLGEACLAYRRAELLDPRMAEASQNLRLLQRKLGFLEFTDSGMERAAGRLSISQWISLTCAGVWLLLLGGVPLVLYRPRHPWSGILLAATICGVLLAGLASAGGAIHRGSLDPANLFIVTANNAVATTGPFPGAKTVIGLPPGSEVKVVAERGPWRFVHIPGTRAGWIDQAALERLWPYRFAP
ncbi:MAG: Tetratricopeptide (TPR) repeat [Verrucomicrobia bacterium]|jgi:tetratricopeptide (TPR) repeat protein|nr:MAG: Tetratricopeptide (TPR) repeat [Verrucomicrobiota bacterium]